MHNSSWWLHQITLSESGCTRFYSAKLANYLYYLYYAFQKNMLQLILFFSKIIESCMMSHYSPLVTTYHNLSRNRSSDYCLLSVLSKLCLRSKTSSHCLYKRQLHTQAHSYFRIKKSIDKQDH